MGHVYGRIRSGGDPQLSRIDALRAVESLALTVDLWDGTNNTTLCVLMKLRWEERAGRACWR